MLVYAPPVLHGEAYHEELGPDWKSFAVLQAREKNRVYQGCLLKSQRKQAGRQGISAVARTS
jgi:hypothetical protein